jgi:hypothetical protein
VYGFDGEEVKEATGDLNTLNEIMPVSFQLLDVSFAQTLHDSQLAVLFKVFVVLLQLVSPLIAVQVSFAQFPVLLDPKMNPLNPTLSDQ